MDTFDLDNLIKRYHSGETIAQLAESVSVDRNRMSRILIEANVKLRGRPEWNKRRIDNIGVIVTRYNAGETMAALAREIGVKREILSGRLRANGAVMRTGAEASRLDKTKILPIQTIQEMFAAGHTIGEIASALGVTHGTIVTRLATVGIRPGGKQRSMTLRWHRLRRDPKALAAYVDKCKMPETSMIVSSKTREASKLSAWPVETEIANALNSRGIPTTPQKSIGFYNVDIAFNELPVAVEIESGGSFYQRKERYIKRIKYILDQGWAVLIVFTQRQNVDFARVTDRLVSFLEIARTNKSVFGSYGVIDRDGKTLALKSTKLNDLARIDGF